MVALPVAPNCLRIRITGKLNTQNIAHIMHAQYAGGTPSVADCNTLAGLIRGAWATRFTSQLPTGASYSMFEVADLATMTGAVGVNTSAVTGTAAAAAGVTNAACAVISWKVGLRYRGGKPRTYVPYGSAAAPANGIQVPGAYVTSLKAAAAGFLTDVNAMTSGTITIALAMVSYYSHNQLRPLGLPYLITGSDVHNRVDTQRRRLGKEF